jgi:hypothetical protein
MSLLDVFILKLTPVTPSSGCITSSADEKSQSLKSSTKIVFRVTEFLIQLKRSFSKFEQFCGRGKSINIEVIKAIGDMMTDLVELWSDLGGLTAAEEISKQGHLTKKFVVSKACIWTPSLPPEL